MKTILYLITQSELGGAQKYVFDLAVNLKNEFRTVVAFGEQGDGGELAQKLKAKNIEYHIIPSLKREISFSDDWKALWQIKKLIKKTKPDIIHLNSSKISILGALAGWLYNSKIFNRRAKIIYTVHGWVFNEPLPKAARQKYLRLEKFTARFKDKLICVSHSDYDIAQKEKIAPDQKLITIHNGIKPINFLAKDEAKKILQTHLPAYFNLNEADLLLGSIGNLYKNKGYEYLIEAIRILVDNGLNAKTVIIGEGQGRKELENWISQLSLKKNIFLAGRINAAPLLKAFDAYVCSSVKEGLSYTIIEAMSAELPIIATEVGGNSELIKNEQEGLLVPSKDPKKIARAIIKIANDFELAQKLARQARLKAEQNFTIEKMLEKTKQVYSE